VRAQECPRGTRSTPESTSHRPGGRASIPTCRSVEDSLGGGQAASGRGPRHGGTQSWARRTCAGWATSGQPAERRDRTESTRCRAAPAPRNGRRRGDQGKNIRTAGPGAPRIPSRSPRGQDGCGGRIGAHRSGDITRVAPGRSADRLGPKAEQQSRSVSLPVA
jgi:hypothetical protein